MSAASKIPPLRFKGCDGVWKEKRLGEMGSPYNGLSGKCKSDFCHGDGRYVTYLNVFNNPVVKTEECDRIEIDKSQNEVRDGDVFFTTSSETPEEVGMSSVWKGNGENTYLNSFCFGYRPKSKINANFWAYMLRSDSFRDRIVVLAQGISRYNISKGKVMELPVSLPGDAEQQKIGSTFCSLDALIADRETAVEKLRTFKKAMLEKMFLRVGAKVPEMRFKGFGGVWGKVRLDNVCTMFSGGTPTSTNHTFYGGDIDWVSISDMTKSGKYITETEKKLTQEGFENCSAKMFPPSTLLFAMYASIGKCCIAPKSVCSSQAILGLYNLDGVDVEFLYYDLSRREKMFAKMGQMGSQANLSKTIVSEIEVNMPPTFEEQQKIGAYFRSLDALISARQKEVGKLKDLKKALLDRMFV